MLNPKLRDLIKKVEETNFRNTLWLIPIVLFSACGGSGGDDSSNNDLNGIVVNRASFEEGRLGCQLIVNATNTTDVRKTALLVYEAFDSSNRSIGLALTQGYSIPANSTLTSRRDTTGNLFLDNQRRLFRTCAGIASIELSIEQSIINP